MYLGLWDVQWFVITKRYEEVKKKPKHRECVTAVYTIGDRGRGNEKNILTPWNACTLITSRTNGNDVLTVGDNKKIEIKKK